MAQPRKPAKKKVPSRDTPLDSAQKKIAEEEAKLQAKMQRYEKLIQEAPKIKQERQRIQREQFISRASRAESRAVSPAALPDRRMYELNAGAPYQHKRLRAERNRGRLTFFILLAVFGCVAAWVYFTFKQ
jgi:hypothetical protein